MYPSREICPEIAAPVCNWNLLAANSIINRLFTEGNSAFIRCRLEKKRAVERQRIEDNEWSWHMTEREKKGVRHKNIHASTGWERLHRIHIYGLFLFLSIHNALLFVCIISVYITKAHQYVCSPIRFDLAYFVFICFWLNF